MDGHDPALSTGWSVLVHGTAMLVYEAEDRERLDALADKPWIPLDVNTFWVRIRPEEITGREVLSTTDVAAGPLRAPTGARRTGRRAGALGRLSCGQHDLQRAGLTGGGRTRRTPA